MGLALPLHFLQSQEPIEIGPATWSLESPALGQSSVAEFLSMAGQEIERPHSYMPREGNSSSLGSPQQEMAIDRKLQNPAAAY